MIRDAKLVMALWRAPQAGQGVVTVEVMAAVWVLESVLALLPVPVPVPVLASCGY